MRVSLSSIVFFLLLGPLLQAQEGFIKGVPALAYRETGEGKETVIVLHGGPAAAHDYLRPEWDALGKGARVVYYDQRGCGRSEKAACYSWREHVSDLKRVIQQAGKGQKVVLAGSSWGATLALLYAYTYPADVKGLILSGTYNWTGKGKKQKDCTAYEGEDLPFVRPHRDSFYYSAVNMASTATKYLGYHRRSFMMTVNSMAEGPTLQQLSAITLPVLVFKGTEHCPQTPKEGADLYGSVLPRAEVYLVAGACHDPWLSQPLAFFTKAVEFLKQLKGGGESSIVNGEW